MMTGMLLVLSSGGLFWRSFTERRLWSHWGHAVMSLAVMLSAFRRFVYTPGQVFGQVELDYTVVSIFFVGSVLLVIDAAHRIWMDLPPDGGHRMAVFVKRLLWPMVFVPTSVLLLSAGLLSWSGEGSEALTLDQAISAIHYHEGQPAAAARLMDIAEQAVRKAQEARDAEALRIVAHRSELLREMLR